MAERNGLINDDPKKGELMKSLWVFLKTWGGPLAVFAILVALGWYFGSGSSIGYWWIAIFMGAWFLYAFTNIFPGEDWQQRTGRKGVVWERRSSMVSFSYIFAIFILLSPLWSRTLIDNQLDDQDEDKYPTAIVRGCAAPSKNPDAVPPQIDPKSIPKEVRCDTDTDQWLINLGGTILKTGQPPIPAKPVAEVKRPAAEQKSDGTDAGGKSAGSENRSSIRNPVRIHGGLVVPLYFVIIALMGGAVSLLRRVPEIQRRSEHDYVGTEKEPRLSPGEVRERLGFQIIQFISAPLIAVTAYHAIGPESKTASVALGFTSGFGSESILLMIRGVVEGIKPQSITQQPAKGIAGGVVVVQATNQPVADAELSVVGQPLLTTKSDLQGLFAIHDIPPGDHVIDATLNNQNANIKVTISAGKTTVCRIGFA